MQQGNETGGTLPPFMAGLTQILDLRANFVRHPYSGSDWERDVAAFRSDWLALGQDMQAAFWEGAPPDDGSHRSESKISL